MIRTHPEEFKRFNELLMLNAPEGYEPFYFALVKNSKDPVQNGQYDPVLSGSWLKRKLTFENAHALMEKGYNIGIAALSTDKLVIVDVDDITQVKEVKNTLICNSSKRIGRHCFYFTDDESTYEKEDAIFLNSAKDNIATDEAGEVRSNNQYVVCAGSFFERSEEEIQRIPEEDRENAGLYSVFFESKVSSITYEELPEVYRRKHELEQQAEIEYRNNKESKGVGNVDNDSKYKSALWDLKITDLTGMENNPHKRFAMLPEFHKEDSKTGGNASISGDLLHCWRHNVSHSAFTYLLVKAGFYTCNDAGRKFKGSRFGADQTPENVFRAWLYAKENQLIPENDPIPSSAMAYYAVKEKYCSEKDIRNGWKLPREIYNVIVEKTPFNTGREKIKASPIKKLGQAVQKSVSDPLSIALALQEAVPIYYDSGKNYWLWDDTRKCYERKDETDILVEIADNMDLTLYNSKMKNEILEAIRITSRGRNVKEPLKSWIQFKNKVVDINTLYMFDATPEYLFCNPIPHDLGESEKTPVIDQLFTDWMGDLAPLLYEIGAYCLYDAYPLHRIFALVGSGSNGKSQYQSLIKNLVGDHNYAASDLDMLSKNQFAAAKLYKKKVALVGETAYTLSRTELLKKLCGEDPVSCEFKGKDSFDFINTAKIIIATNGLPQTGDRSDGFYRRWCILEFKNKFTDGKSIVSTIPEVEFENLCLRCIKILKEILETSTLPHEPKQEERKMKYEKLSNPVQAFIDDECKVSENNLVPAWYMHQKYLEYCDVKGHRKLTVKEFNSVLKNLDFEIEKKRWFNIEQMKEYKSDLEDGKKGAGWDTVHGIKVAYNCSSHSSHSSHYLSQVFYREDQLKSREEQEEQEEQQQENGYGLVDYIETRYKGQKVEPFEIIMDYGRTPEGKKELQEKGFNEVKSEIEKILNPINSVFCQSAEEMKVFLEGV